jgi:aminoglycoside 6'-N-acetyltransferase
VNLLWIAGGPHVDKSARRGVAATIGRRPRSVVPVIELRGMRSSDVDLIDRWDTDPDVAAFGGGSGWYDWPAELRRQVAWRELLIAEQDGRPVGFVQLIDAAEEEFHYWGDIEAGTWAIDIWIGDPSDRGRGIGSEVMRQALDRCFERHGAHSVVIDPIATNERAIRFYQRLGFEFVEQRRFGDDLCAVHRIAAP